MEIDNTDAEGRLVLCDALACAAEDSPALLLDFATLTGAARRARPGVAGAVLQRRIGGVGRLAAGERERDPLWRMPLWRPYLRYLTSNIADIANAGPSKMAGSISAALYLGASCRRRYRGRTWTMYSWNDADRPGRPAGGEAQPARGVGDVEGEGLGHRTDWSLGRACAHTWHDDGGINELGK